MEYVAVDIQGFRKALRDINFDVYLKLSEGNFAHVFSRTTGLDYKRLAQYVQKGVSELYIKRSDEGSYSEYIVRTAEQVFSDPTTPEEKKIATLLNMTEQNMAEIFSQVDVADETAEQTKKVVNNYIQLLADSPKTLSVILRLAAHGDYLYYHSVASAVFSMFIARFTGQFNRRLLEIVGMGGFLHDIGCTQLPNDITDSRAELTPAQWKLMRSHPKIGLKMLENTPSVPDEVRYIVYQHHEEPSGNGYPNGLRGPVIYYPAKIVAVADAFSALISKRPFRPAYTVEQAVQILKSEAGKYDAGLVKIVEQLFVKNQRRAA